MAVERPCVYLYKEVVTSSPPAQSVKTGPAGFAPLSRGHTMTAGKLRHNPFFSKPIPFILLACISETREYSKLAACLLLATARRLGSPNYTQRCSADSFTVSAGSRRDLKAPDLWAW